MPPASKRESSGRHAVLVAAGILLSRLAGLVRQRVFAHYFGQMSDAADAFNAAFVIPNFLQNLLGEGVLSASFIPVYAKLRSEGKDADAKRVAGATAAILGLLVSVLVLAGYLAAPFLAGVLAVGYHGAKRELTVQLVRILFPGAGLFVFSAWCLGILNSHRRFFLSYAAPVVWSGAMIATLLAFGPRMDLDSLAAALAWGSVAGCALLVLVQLPAVLRLLGGLHLRLDTGSPHVREVVRNFLPVFGGRGVVQISGWVDSTLATLLGTGARAALANAQTLYMLPVSLFGMAVSAAELPAMSSALGDPEEVARSLRRRLDAGLRRIAFFVVPSAMAFLLLGDVIAAAIFQTGRFTQTDAVFVWAILGGSALGLLPNTMGRLYSSTFYALRDTRTPVKFAVLRVSLAACLGYFSAIHLRAWLGLEPQWGAAALTTASGLAGWLEFALLQRSLKPRIGATGLNLAYVTKLWTAAAGGAALAWGVKLALGPAHPIIAGGAVLGAYGCAYLGLAWLMRIPRP